jgi:hypothetical protein
VGLSRRAETYIKSGKYGKNGRKWQKMAESGKKGPFWQKRSKTVVNGSNPLFIKKVRFMFGPSDSGTGVWKSTKK